MAVYRYSSEAVDRLVRRNMWRTRALFGLLFPIVVLGTQSTRQDSDPELWWVPAVVVVVLLGMMFVVTGRTTKGRDVIESLVLVLDDDEFTAESSVVTVRILREDVTRLQRNHDRIVVRGRGLQNMIEARRDLDRFDDLSERLEAWVPAGVVRDSSSKSPSFWWTIALAAYLVLLVGAFVGTVPVLVIGCSVAVAAATVGSVVWVWRLDSVDVALKRRMLYALPVAVAMLARAWMLGSGS